VEQYLQIPDGAEYHGFYARAIERLQDLELAVVCIGWLLLILRLYSQVPTDMLEIIWGTVREINLEADHRVGASYPLGADALLPLFEYVLIHAEVFDIHRTLSYVQVL